MKAYQRISEKSISLQEIPNLLPVTKITPKKNKENICVTQVHGSMEGKKILEKVSAIFSFFSFHLFYSHKKNITRSTSITT